MAGESVDRGDDFIPTPDDDALDATGAPVQAEDDTLDDAPPVAKADKALETKSEPEPQRDDKGRFIPKARFDEAVTREREKAEAANRQVAELQAQLKAVNRDATTVDLEKQIAELRKADRRAGLDGDDEKSLEIATQIDRLNRQIIIQETTGISERSSEEAREGIRVETTIERLEAAYPVLKEGTDEFDQGLVDLVLAQQSQLIARERMSPSQALIKATTDIMARFQPATKADEEPAGGLSGANGVNRTQAAKAKNIDAALRTPPDTRDVGLDTDKAGMKNGLPVPQSIEDLKAIPLATLKRMRGDM